MAEEQQQPDERREDSARREELRSLSPDERVRRARELAAQMRRQRAAERGEARTEAAEAAAPPETPTGPREPAPRPGTAEVAAPPETPAQPPPEAATAPASGTGWRLATGPAQRLLAATQAEVEAARRRTPIAVPAPSRRLVSRRTFILSSFWSGLGLALASMLGGLDFLWPRKIVGFGGPIPVPAEQVPKPGDPPIHVIKGKFWLANLKPGEGVYGELGAAGDGGLLAMWQKCPHLGCTVPWRQDFVFGGVPSWFRCPCHGSTYTRAGVRVFGPAPRPLDTMAIEKQNDGSIIVQTGQITQGGNDNPQRAVAYP